MNTVISLSEVGGADRIKLAQSAAEDILALIRSRFSEAEGYKYTCNNDPLQGSAFGQYIQVRRGLNFTLVVTIRATDMQMSAVKISVGSDSTLTFILLFPTFFMGFFWLLIFPLETRRSLMKETPGLFGGLMLAGGIIVALAIHKLQPLSQLKRETGHELMGTFIECVNRRIKNQKTD